MNLFNKEGGNNILPKEGNVVYYGKIMGYNKANEYYKKLMEKIAWRNDEAFIFGKHIITKRKVAWYGDEEYEYSYSNFTKRALKWTKELLELKGAVDDISKTTYNSCLLNLYHDGSEGMAWHSDDEKELLKGGSIASLSLGAERKFSLKHKQSKETVSLILESGSLLVMNDDTQTNWLHTLPKTKKVTRPRINLTFRMMNNKS